MLYLNGKIISEETACINPRDRGFLLGDGLFETIRCNQGSPIALEQHWQRLKAGAAFLQIPLLITFDDAYQNIVRLLNINQLTDHAGARITLTRGTGERGIGISPHLQPTMLITTFTINKNPNPVEVCISDYCVNEQSPLTRFKTLNYLNNILAHRQALASGFDDAILLNTKKKLVGASVANLFFIKNDEIFTPAIDEGALPGITRNFILQLADQNGFSTHEGIYELDDLFNADEAFLTNSLISVQPVKGINSQVYFKKLKNSISAKLYRLLLEIHSK